MTRDGVNDAPAIKAADVGITMRTCAKSADRMILTDGTSATIVFAAGQAGPWSATIPTSITATCGSARCARADYGKPEVGGMT